MLDKISNKIVAKPIEVVFIYDYTWKFSKILCRYDKTKTFNLQVFETFNFYEISSP